MDVDTLWPYHHRVRRLQAQHPDRWPVYWTAYLALLAEAWRSGSRLKTLEEAWVPALPCTITEAAEALQGAGIIDRLGRVPLASWRDWYGPVQQRLEQLAEAGKRSAQVRRERMLHDRSTYDVPKPSKPSKPSKPRAVIDEGPVQAGASLRALGFFPPGERGDE
jgi:hypothetical protein